MIELYADISRPGGSLVKSIDVKTEIGILGLCRGSVMPMRIWPVAPIDGAVSSPFYRKLSTSGMTIAVGIGTLVGTSTVLAYAGDEDWTAVDSNGVGYFQGVLSLATDEIETAFAANPASVSAYFEIRLTDPNGPRVIYQRQVDIANSLLRQGTTAPVNADLFQTQAAARAVFPQWDNSQDPNNWGRGIIIVSPDGTKKGMLRLENDGSFTQSLIS